MHKIEITWDSDKQSIANINFNNEEFKSLEMLRAVLEIAVENLKFQQGIMRAQTIQAMAQQAAQDEAIRNRIMRG